MNHQKSIALIPAILFCIVGFCQQVYLIPKQTFQPYKVLGFYEGYKVDTAKINFKMAIDSFEISSQVFYKHTSFILNL